MAQPTPIPHAVCGGKHWTEREVHVCNQYGPATAYVPQVEPTTDRQLWYVRELLKGDEAYAKSLGKVKCSDYIKDLKAGRARPVAAQAQATPAPTPPAPRTWTLKTPQAMVEATREGRFAVRPDTETPFKFVRIFRPKTGKKKGALVLQTQHSDAYKDCVIVWPSGQVSVYDRRIDDSLLLVVVDPITAAINYGIEKGVCCRCGRELTDGRSIYYGIGPECETYYPEIINRTDEELGAYYPGKTRTVS